MALGHCNCGKGFTSNADVRQGPSFGGLASRAGWALAVGSTGTLVPTRTATLAACAAHGSTRLLPTTARLAGAIVTALAACPAGALRLTALTVCHVKHLRSKSPADTQEVGAFVSQQRCRGCFSVNPMTIVP